jgi:hypothetical protein
VNEMGIFRHPSSVPGCTQLPKSPCLKDQSALVRFADYTVKWIPLTRFSFWFAREEFQFPSDTSRTPDCRSHGQNAVDECIGDFASKRKAKFIQGACVPAWIVIFPFTCADPLFGASASAPRSTPSPYLLHHQRKRHRL